MNYSDWQIYKKGIISKRAPHIPLKVEVDELFKYFKSGCYVRWYSNFDKAESEKFYFVIKDGDFSMDTISSKTRNMVRRCISECAVQIVDYQQIARGGGEVYLSECRRFDRKGFGGNVKSFENWERGIRNAAERGEEFWGVFYRDEVIAYGVAKSYDEIVDLVTWKCNYEKYKNFYPAYGLVYKMTEYYLQKNGVKYLNDGNRSFSEHSHVQDFLVNKFGYRKAFTELNVCFKWWLKLVIILIIPFEKCIKNKVVLSFIRMYKWSR